MERMILLWLWRRAMRRGVELPIGSGVKITAGPTTLRLTPPDSAADGEWQTMRLTMRDAWR